MAWHVVPARGREYPTKIRDDRALCVPARVRLVDLANHGIAQFDVDRGRRYAAGWSQ